MRHARARSGSVAAAAAVAIGLGLLAGPATSAAADAPSPVVAFIDFGANHDDNALKVGAPDGTAATRLTPSSVETVTYAVSADGNSLVVGGVVSTASGNDATWGVSLVQRDPGTGVTTTRLITTLWDTRVAMSADGGTVWWLYGGSVYRYRSGSGTTLVGSKVFTAPSSSYYPYTFAVSPDGTQGAVVFQRLSSAGNVIAGKVVARPLDGSTGPRFDRLYATSTPIPAADTLAWVDDATLLYADVSAGDHHLHTTTLSADGVSGTTVDGPTGEYQVQQLGSDWWSWHDTGSASAITTQFGTSADPMVAPATLASRVDGDHTSWYRPTLAAPPVMGTATNRATAHPSLYLSASLTTTGKRVVYASWNDYLATMPGATLTNDANYTSRGVLESSTDGHSFRTAAYTSSDHPVAWPGQPGTFGEGQTGALTRNTWFRWRFAGDVFAAPGTSRTVKVSVRPTLTVSVRTYGSKHRVYGHVSRKGGKAVLYRIGANYAKTTIGAAKISSTGAYSFGIRSLRPGRYRVYVPSDAYWAYNQRDVRF